MKFLGLRTLKSSIGVVMAIYVATMLGLDFPVSAGLIAILSILDTKRQTWIVAGKRALSAVIGLSIAVAAFWIFGFHIYTLGIFLMLFIPIINSLNLNEGTMTNIVLVTHLLSYGEITTHALANEFALMGIGIASGLLLNMHIPSKENKVRTSQLEIEEKMKKVLQVFALELKNACDLSAGENSLQELRQTLREGKSYAYQYMNNYFFIDNSYYVEYMVMRKRQYDRLKAMSLHIDGVILTQDAAKDVSAFTELVASGIRECNTGKELLEQLEVLLDKYRFGELPQTRQAFEDRARLFLFINELQTMIQIKVEFMEEYGDIKYCDA